MDENQELHNQQRSAVISSGIRSGIWGFLATGLAVGAYFAFASSMPLTALGLGIGAAFATYKGFTTNVDQAVQFEDINAQRSAEYTARALARELKNEGLVVTQAPVRADGRSWGNFVADQPESSQNRLR